MDNAGLPLTLALAGEIEARLRALRAGWGERAPSEYAYSNLYLFRHAHDYRYLPGPLPRITGQTYDGCRHVLPLFDPRQAGWPELAAALAGHDCLYPVPETVLAGLDASRLQWEDAPADADYFYPAENFRSYQGELLRKKRNLMHQLLASHRVTAQPLSSASRADALTVLDAWLADKQKHAGEADDGACREALQWLREFGMEGWIYHADGHPAGFVLAQRYSPSVAVMRFAKGSDRYKGIYQYMFHHYCAGDSALQWVNFEQDLGLANFRQTKRSYQPSDMLRKFRVRLRA